MKKCAIFLANGFEDTEAIATYDVIKRLGRLKKDFVDVEFVSITDELKVEGAWGTKVTADKTLHKINFDNYEGLILPGGNKGVENLFECDYLLEKIKKHSENNKLVAAICAAPQILGKLGLVDNKEITFYPGCEKYLDKAIKRNTASAITDGNIVTGSSIGGALLFALQIVDYLSDTDTMLELHKTLVFNY